MKITKTDIFKKEFDLSSDKIIVTTFSEKSLLELTMQDNTFYQQYILLIENDYMLYMHTKGSSYFIKRNKIYTIWQRTDLIQYNELFYTLEKPKEKNECAPVRLLIIFSSLPDQTNYYSPNIALRCFSKDYPNLSNQVIKNTIIMRIMDLNLSNGSYYLNTLNYPLFEQDVQEAIKNVSEENKIAHDDIVLYGACKGGTGALYHSYLGNYKAVSVSPTISSYEGQNEMLNSTIFNKLKSDSILNKLKYEKRNSSDNQIIIDSPVNYTDYEKYNELLSGQAKVINIFDSHIKYQSDVSKNSIVEQSFWINQLLLSSENLKRENERLITLLKEIKINDKI